MENVCHKYGDFLSMFLMTASSYPSALGPVQRDEHKHFPERIWRPDLGLDLDRGGGGGGIIMPTDRQVIQTISERSKHVRAAAAEAIRLIEIGNGIIYSRNGRPLYIPTKKQQNIVPHDHSRHLLFSDNHRLDHQLDTLLEQLEDSKNPVEIIVVDAHSGRGKTSFEAKIHEACIRKNIVARVLVVDGDEHLAHGRKSKERKEMLKGSVEQYWNSFAKWDDVNALLCAIEMFGVKGFQVKFRQMYHRKTGTIEPGNQVITEAPKTIVVLSLTNAFKVGRMFEAVTGKRITKIFLHGDLQDIFHRLIARDIATHTRSRIDAEIFRRKELELQADTMIENCQEADIIALV